MSELEELMKVFGEAGGDTSILVREDIAHFAASGNKILSTRAIQEIRMDIKLETGASARFIAHCIFPKAEKVRQKLR